MNTSTSTEQLIDGPHEDPKREQQILAVLDNMDPDFIACRDFNHSWKDFGARWLKQFHYYEQILKCTRCATQKHRALSATGHIIESHYEYPDGYLMPHGTGRLTTHDRDQVRLAGVKRATATTATATATATTDKPILTVVPE